MLLHSEVVTFCVSRFGYIWRQEVPAECNLLGYDSRWCLHAAPLQTVRNDTSMASGCQTVTTDRSASCIMNSSRVIIGIAISRAINIITEDHVGPIQTSSNEVPYLSMGN